MERHRPVFGEDPPPPASPIRMAYVGRHPTCGHLRALAVDRAGASLDEFVAMAGGLALERIPLEEAQAAFVECDVCREPEQLALV